MTRRLRRDDSGAFLVVWALLLVAILTMVAIVIDLGRLRDTKRRAQRTVDLAAIAGGQNVAGGDVINGCIAAVKYVKSNTPDLSTLPDTCTIDFAAACDPAAPRQMVTTSGPYVVTVRNPIPNSELEDPNYSSALGVGTLPDDGEPCERMRVTVQRTNEVFFAGVVGTSSLTTRATAVVRGFIGTNDKQNAGLVVLERKNCEAITVSGGLASVVVKASFADDGTPRPGTIQVDTKALEPSGGNCSNAGGNPSTKYAVYGTQLTSATGVDRPGAPAVEAESIGGAPGRLDLYALTHDRLTIHGAYSVPTGVSPAPTPGVIASRRVVDDVYNAPAGGGAGRVFQLKSDSRSLLIGLADAVALCPLCNAVTAGGALWHVYPPGTPTGVDINGVSPIAPPGGTQPATCSTNTATLIDVTSSYPNVYVNCDPLDVPNVRFASNQVALKGVLKIGSNRMAQFPNASQVIVGGCGGCTGGNKVAINADGALLVNTGPSTPLAKQCSDGVDNDGDGKADYHATFGVGDIGCQDAADWDELSCVENRTRSSTPPAGPSRLVVATGPIETSISAIVELCQTFVLMADGNSLPFEDASMTTDVTCAGYTDPSGTFVAQPCPRESSLYKGYLSLFGLIDWIAPDQTGGPRNTSLANQHFEDLALWTETSQQSEIKGQGNTITGGVFFFPNALMKFSGQASQFIDLNAQFISRRLELSGKGTLSMKPNPNDVVETPSPYFRLIR